jgi:hypothetical protein
MSKYNNFANEEKFRSQTRDWLRKTCPLVYLFAPSNEGKTTLLGSMFPTDGGTMPLWTYKHDDYCPVLYVDADQGGTTIEHMLGDERLCEYRDFDQRPDQHLKWMFDQLDYATRADCNAIVIEGLTAVHDKLVSAEMRKHPGAVGFELQRCYIAAAGYAGTLMETIREIKQHRTAAGKGVPIIVTLNTKEQSIDPEKDAGARHVPAWSNNLIERTKRTSDAHIQLVRKPTGTVLVTTKIDGPHPHCKMRSADVADAVMRESNLNLPGLFTLWSVTQQTKAKKTRAAVDSRQESGHDSTPTQE